MNSNRSEYDVEQILWTYFACLHFTYFSEEPVKTEMLPAIEQFSHGGFQGLIT